MPANNAVQRTNLILLGVFLAALGAHAWWVTRNWTAGFMPGHEFRQAQTAITSYYIDQQNNFSLLYETPIVGKPWVSILMEVPIYEWSVVGLSRWAHVPHVVAARTISLACFYLMLPALYLLLGRLGLPGPRRLLVLALTLVCPVYIFYSRAFLMDSMELMFCAWFVFGFVRMMDRRRWPWFLLATVAGTGAALVKSATLAIWLWPPAGYVAWLLWRDVRLRAGWAAFLETAFWGAAGVAVPLGALREWIVLTDPLKAAHASAWIFTSENLSLGNWGLNDLHARFAPQIWSTLSNCWREAIMPPWLLLALLAAGLVFLPRVRWPALALAGMFFWAQLLFPYAYAYQDYYFYSCAVFLAAGLGVLLSGLLDSRLPRWLVWPLLAVPFAGQIATYRGGYYSAQVAKSAGGFSYTAAMRDFLPKDSVIIVAGDDWSAITPFYAQHRALMVRNGLENNGEYLDRAFADLADEDVSALVLMGSQKHNHFIIDRAAAAFGLDTVPSVVHGRAEIYCSLRYRDRFKQDLKEVRNLGDLTNEPLPPVPVTIQPSLPFRVRPVTAHMAFPFVSPAPLRAHFQYGLDYIWVESRKVIFAHPESDIWVRAPGRSSRIEWDFGLVPDAYQRAGPRTDGVEFTVTGISAGEAERVIFKRTLDPVNRPQDQGTQKMVIPYDPRPGEILHFSDRPGASAAFDWAYWSRVEVK